MHPKDTGDSLWVSVKFNLGDLGSGSPENRQLSLLVVISQHLSMTKESTNIQTSFANYHLLNQYLLSINKGPGLTREKNMWGKTTKDWKLYVWSLSENVVNSTNTTDVFLLWTHINQWIQSFTESVPWFSLNRSQTEKAQAQVLSCTMD